VIFFVDVDDDDDAMVSDDDELGFDFGILKSENPNL